MKWCVFVMKFESQVSINEVIAKNLKKLRKDRKLSLDAVSEMTGVSKSMLGQIERNESSPTISTLWKIATGLHISFTSLMETPMKEAVVIKNTDIQPLSSDSQGFSLYPIFPLEKGRNFEIIYIEIEPGAFSESVAHEAKTEEFMLVYSGIVEVILDDNDVYTVHSGCSIHYSANKKHIYKNISSDTAKLYMVIYYNQSY